MCLDKFLNIKWLAWIIFFSNLCGRGRHSRQSTVFINEPPSSLEVMVLIFYFETTFQSNENRFMSLVLKAKKQKAIQLQ